MKTPIDDEEDDEEANEDLSLKIVPKSILRRATTNSDPKDNGVSEIVTDLIKDEKTKKRKNTKDIEAAPEEDVVDNVKENEEPETDKGTEISTEAIETNPVQPPHNAVLRSTCVSKKSKYDVSNAKPPLDRLSELPECLIVDKILSLLPTEDAVRTGVLSTRWKNLWKHIDKVVHRMTKRYSDAHVTRFLSFVDHTVMECVCAKSISLDTLPLSDKVNFHSFNNWFDRLLQRVYSQGRKVESLTVHMVDISRFRYAPPEWFYHNSTLVKLDISHWNLTTIRPAAVVSWTFLRSLTMAFVSFGDDELLPKILSGCPVLENLDLFDVGIINSLKVTSRCLLKLSVAYHLLNEGGSFLEINAPRLQFLNLSGWFFHFDVRLVNVSPLVHAKLDFDSDDDARLDLATKLLESLHHAQEITIGKEFILALSFLKLSGKPCPLLSCKRLTFIMSVYKYELTGITCLLQSSHNLETLVIEVRKYDEEDIDWEVNEICDFEAATYLSSMESGDDLHHLKSIEVTYCYCKNDPKDNNDIEYFVFELVAYILRKAHVLERFVIAPKEEFCKCSIRNCAREQSSMLSMKLLQFFMDRKQVCEWKLRNSYLEIIV